MEPTKSEAKKFDQIVTDMCRSEKLCNGVPVNELDGFKLLQRIEEIGSLALQAPVVIYAAYWKEGIRSEARRYGAFGRTNSPKVFLALLVKAVSNN